eukprot:12713715-Alexandrium_andersonii.AAC.1
MSASLVGSEMCIRDSPAPQSLHRLSSSGPEPGRSFGPLLQGPRARAPRSMPVTTWAQGRHRLCRVVRGTPGAPLRT